MRLVNLTINFDIMLYLIESGIYAKIGYTSDNKTLEKRLSSYQTHNPQFRLVDITDGTREDEQRLQALYKMYSVDGNREWTYAKNLAVQIWVEYRASKENVDYYEEFGTSPYQWCENTYGGIIGGEAQLEAMEKDLITTKNIDLYTEFRDYYERYTEQSASLNEIIQR